MQDICQYMSIYIYISKISDTVLKALHGNGRKHQSPWVAISCPCNFNLSPKYAHASDLDPAVAVVSHCPSTFLLNKDALDPMIHASPCHACHAKSFFHAVRTEKLLALPSSFQLHWHHAKVFHAAMKGSTQSTQSQATLEAISPAQYWILCRLLMPAMQLPFFPPHLLHSYLFSKPYLQRVLQVLLFHVVHVVCVAMHGFLALALKHIEANLALQSVTTRALVPKISPRISAELAGWMGSSQAVTIRTWQGRLKIAYVS